MNDDRRDLDRRTSKQPENEPIAIERRSDQRRDGEDRRS